MHETEKIKELELLLAQGLQIMHDNSATRDWKRAVTAQLSPLPQALGKPQLALDSFAIPPGRHWQLDAYIHLIVWLLKRDNLHDRKFGVDLKKFLAIEVARSRAGSRWSELSPEEKRLNADGCAATAKVIAEKSLTVARSARSRGLDCEAVTTAPDPSCGFQIVKEWLESINVKTALQLASEFGYSVRRVNQATRNMGAAHVLAN